MPEGTNTSQQIMFDKKFFAPTKDDASHHLAFDVVGRKIRAKCVRLKLDMLMLV